MKVLILGGSGNLGATLASIAESQGHTVRLTFRRHAPSYVGGLESVQWDAMQGPPPADLRGFQPDAVVHSIATINPDDCETHPAQARRVNAQSVDDTVKFMEPRYLVYISSDYVFDGSQGGYTPQTSPNPINTYGRTKVEGESFALGAPRCLIVRTALFGAGLAVAPTTRWERQLDDLISGKLVTLTHDQVGTPLWTHTLATLIMRLVEVRHEGVVHAAGPEIVSKAQLMRRLALRVGITDPPIRAVSTSSLRPLARRPLNVSLVPSEVVRSTIEYPQSLDDDLDRYARALWPVPRAGTGA
jgi:dTDP-4-dehydrorhamnose reductase